MYNTNNVFHKIAPSATSGAADCGSELPGGAVCGFEVTGAVDSGNKKV